MFFSLVLHPIQMSLFKHVPCGMRSSWIQVGNYKLTPEKSTSFIIFFNKEAISSSLLANCCHQTSNNIVLLIICDYFTSTGYEWNEDQSSVITLGLIAL